ncbi:MAG: hypothetical protein ACRDGD_11070 [Candidatus Limnocylindria bacterium]
MERLAFRSSSQLELQAELHRRDLLADARATHRVDRQRGRRGGAIRRLLGALRPRRRFQRHAPKGGAV